MPRGRQNYKTLAGVHIGVFQFAELEQPLQNLHKISRYKYQARSGSGQEQQLFYAKKRERERSECLKRQKAKTC